ncbi:MAG: hypothetical protein A2X77_00990 [Gammaproteobacteria bacterium GWE2_42_36]|nr:MAG: hypothetical protein A2X77_00990 [Gammaproteobacteria bacterium GWE2_42_36]
MIKSAKSFLPPLLSLTILMLGCSAFTTLLTLRIHAEGYTSWLAGILTAAYYFGFAIGSFETEPLVVRIGLIRSYAALAALLTAMVLIQGLFFIPWLWVVLRFISGICVGTLFIVIQSWLLCYSTSETRGQILAVYMTVFYASQGFAQLLLFSTDPKAIFFFVLTAIFCALSIIPVTMTSTQSPQIEKRSPMNLRQLFKISPVGVLACLFSGGILSCLYGIYPMYISLMGYSIHEVSVVMAMVIFGCMLLQYPAGYISDHVNKRMMLFFLCLINMGICLLVMIFAHHNIYLFVFLSFLLGGFIAVLYSLGISCSSLNLGQKDMIAATQGLLFAYSLGAVLGPLTVPLFMRTLGPAGLLMFFMVLLGSILIIIYIYRNRKPGALAINDVISENPSS